MGGTRAWFVGSWGRRERGFDDVLGVGDAPEGYFHSVLVCLAILWKDIFILMLLKQCSERTF